MTASSDSTRPSLILRIKDARDDDAWATFVETYAPLVYRYCRRQGAQDSDAADVAQEVMAEVARSVRAFEYQPERGRFRDWLGVVTRTRLLNHLRSGRRAARDLAGGPLDGQDPTGDPGPEWAEEFHAQVLRTALDRIRPSFEPATWRAFERVWIDREPAPLAAQALGMPVEKVWVAKSRVLKRLREEVIVLAEDIPLYIPLK
jgi:RNA polymerase sigma-70 factor (ECF subfamily)